MGLKQSAWKAVFTNFQTPHYGAHLLVLGVSFEWGLWKHGSKKTGVTELGLGGGRKTFLGAGCLKAGREGLTYSAKVRPGLVAAGVRLHDPNNQAVWHPFGVTPSSKHVCQTRCAAPFQSGPMELLTVCWNDELGFKSSGSWSESSCCRNRFHAAMYGAPL